MKAITTQENDFQDKKIWHDKIFYKWKKLKRIPCLEISHVPLEQYRALLEQIQSLGMSYLEKAKDYDFLTAHEAQDNKMKTECVSATEHFLQLCSLFETNILLTNSRPHNQNVKLMLYFVTNMRLPFLQFCRDFNSIGIPSSFQDSLPI